MLSGEFVRSAQKLQREQKQRVEAAQRKTDREKAVQERLRRQREVHEEELRQRRLAELAAAEAVCPTCESCPSSSYELLDPKLLQSC